MPYAHLERCSACSVFCSRGCPATDTGFRHQGSSHNQSAASFRLIFGRSSPRPPCPQAPQWYPRVAKPSSIIPSPRPPSPQIPQCHPHVPNNPTISLKPASNRTSTALRHGDLAHRYSRAILAWRRGSSDRSSARPPSLQVPQGHPHVAKMVFYLRLSMK